MKFATWNGTIRQISAITDTKRRNRKRVRIEEMKEMTQIQDIHVKSDTKKGGRRGRPEGLRQKEQRYIAKLTPFQKKRKKKREKGRRECTEGPRGCRRSREGAAVIWCQKYREAVVAETKRSEACNLVSVVEGGRGCLRKCLTSNFPDYPVRFLDYPVRFSGPQGYRCVDTGDWEK